MEPYNFKDLLPIIESIYPSIKNVNSLLTKFNSSLNELELQKIDNELHHIKKILDANTLYFDTSNNKINNLTTSINDKIEHIKNFYNESDKK